MRDLGAQHVGGHREGNGQREAHLTIRECACVCACACVRVRVRVRVRVCACVCTWGACMCARPTVASSGEARSIARASSMLLSTVPTSALRVITSIAALVGHRKGSKPLRCAITW